MFLFLFLPLLGLDAQRRSRSQQQAAQTDRVAGFLTPAVLAVGQALECPVNLVEQLLLTFEQAQLPLALLLRTTDIRRIAARLVIA